MQINKTNNIIFLKNLESNIIEEALVVLKENINLKQNIKNDNFKKFEEINLLKEAELLINEEINKSNLEFEKFKINKLERKIKFLKYLNITLVLGYIAYFLFSIYILK